MLLTILELQEHAWLMYVLAIWWVLSAGRRPSRKPTSSTGHHIDTEGLFVLESHY